jgi:hypothetical protein
MKLACDAGQKLFTIHIGFVATRDFIVPVVGSLFTWEMKANLHPWPAHVNKNLKELELKMN